MLQVVICDDEQNTVDLISKQLDIIIKPTIKYNCFKTTSPQNVIQLAGKKDIDLLLIDIEMPEMNGFETVEQALTRNNKALVIFITNIDLYVYESLKYHPFRFIRKSHLEELDEAISSAVLLLKGNMEIFSIPLNSIQHINVRISDIIYFESLHNDVKLVTLNKEYRYRSTLKSIENKLEGKGFVRIHSGYLLNVKFIHLIKQKDVSVCLGDSKLILPISRAGRKILITEYNNSLR